MCTIDYDPYDPTDECDHAEAEIDLGMVAIAFVKRDPARKAAFMDLMKHAVDDIIEEKIGVRPVWPDAPRPAPEHERLDNA
jgi:hypothetical protein